MESGLYTVVEFDKDDKWFVIAEKIINDVRYSYLIRVNEAEDDFIDEYQIVKSSYDGSMDEYMEVVSGDELKMVVPQLMPEAQKIINHQDKLKKFLNLND